MFPYASGYNEFCSCSYCRAERNKKNDDEKTVVVRKIVFRNFLGDMFNVNKVTSEIRNAIVDRYWNELHTSDGLTAMMRLAASVEKGEIFYDSEKQRFYTINRLYI